MSQDDQLGQPREPHAGGQWPQPEQPQPAYAQQPGYAAGGQEAGWGQPAYGSPAGGQPGWPQQAWQQQPPAPRGTNTLAILGFVFAFVFSPAGIVLSALGLRQTRQRNEGGRGLALAGLILSIVFTLLGVLVFVLLAVASSQVADDLDNADPAGTSLSAPQPSGGGQPSAPAAPGATASAGSVAAACDVILPTITGAEDELSSAATEEEALQKLEALSQQLDTAAQGTGDADFQADVARVTAAYRSLGQAVQSGQTPDFQELAEAAAGLGTDCATAGVPG